MFKLSLILYWKWSSWQSWHFRVLLSGLMVLEYLNVTWSQICFGHLDILMTFNYHTSTSFYPGVDLSLCYNCILVQLYAYYVCLVRCVMNEIQWHQNYKWKRENSLEKTHWSEYYALSTGVESTLWSDLCPINQSSLIFYQSISFLKLIWDIFKQTCQSQILCFACNAPQRSVQYTVPPPSHDPCNTSHEAWWHVCICLISTTTIICIVTIA